MSRYQPYSRRELRTLRRGWLERNRILMAGLVLGALGFLALVTGLLVLVSEPSAFSWWLLGAMQVAIVGALLHMLAIGFLVHDRDALKQVRGAWGEENTRSELRIAKRKRLIWGSVDSIGLLIGDVDHFVVTRRGGLVVVDSKWRSDVADVAEMAKAAARVKTRAEGVARSLYERDRARHRGSTNPIAVTPLVVLWGPAQYSVPDGARVDGIEFVSGRQLVRWLGKLDGNLVDHDAAVDLLRKLTEFRAQVATTSSSR